MTNVVIPHFQFPLRLNQQRTAMVVVEQDSAEDVVSAVVVLLGTQAGSRTELMDYGVEDVTFDAPPDLVSVERALQQWEPRANVTLSDSVDSNDELIRCIAAQLEVLGA